MVMLTTHFYLLFLRFILLVFKIDIECFQISVYKSYSILVDMKVFLNISSRLWVWPLLEPPRWNGGEIVRQWTNWVAGRAGPHRAHEGVSGHHDCSPGQEDALDHVEGART